MPRATTGRIVDSTDVGGGALIIYSGKCAGIECMELPIVDDFRIQTPQNTCSYLSDRNAVLDYRIVINVTDDEYTRLLQRGWRRHGLYIFRPKCPTCFECRSLRIPVAEFSPTKSQRRNHRKNHNVRLQVQLPTVSPQHVRR